MRVKVLTAAVAAAACAMALAGCEKIGNADPNGGWSTMTATTDLEYSLILDREIGVIENQLFTRFSMADQVVDGAYPSSSELENAAESASKLQEIIDLLTVTKPTVGHESDRQTTLDLAQEAKDEIDEYVEALKDGSSTAIKKCAEKMQATYVAIGGEANNMNG